MKQIAAISCELGYIVIEGDEEAVFSIDFSAEAPDETSPARGAVAAAAEQIADYLRGERKTFDFPMRPSGTPFQQSVWRALLAVGCGETASYLDIARAVGNEKGVRAVGQAIGRNPISIAVPCHRIVGSNGKLTGYAGELWRKEWLLAHERDRA